MDCGFAGNSDAYGLGIRLGLYFQWISTFLAGQLVPDELESFLDVNTSFTLAVLLVLVYLTATSGNTLQSGSLYAVEAFLLVMFCTAGSLCGLLAAPLPEPPLFHRAKELRKRPTFRVFLLGAAFVVLHIYAFWFYSSGMYHMARLSCGDKVFMFARANLFGLFRIFALVVHSIVSLVIIQIIIVGLYFPYRHAKAPEPEPEPLEEPVNNQSEYQGTVGGSLVSTSLHRATPRLVRGMREKAIRYGILFESVVPINIVIEVTIKFNHIQGVQNVNTTGQLIPLFIGIPGILQLLSKVDARTTLQGLLSLCFERGMTSESESEEQKDEEANPGTSRAEECKHKIQPNAEGALERRNTI